jgi:hypothetical protein
MGPICNETLPIVRDFRLAGSSTSLTEEAMTKKSFTELGISSRVKFRKPRCVVLHPAARVTALSFFMVTGYQNHRARP